LVAELAVGEGIPSQARAVRLLAAIQFLLAYRAGWVDTRGACGADPLLPVIGLNRLYRRCDVAAGSLLWHSRRSGWSTVATISEVRYMRMVGVHGWIRRRADPRSALTIMKDPRTGVLWALAGARPPAKSDLLASGGPPARHCSCVGTLSRFGVVVLMACLRSSRHWLRAHVVCAGCSSVSIAVAAL